MSRVLIAGAGYVGSALGRRLVDRGDAVWALRRTKARPAPGVEPLICDLLDARGLDRLPEALDAIVYAVSPDRFDDASYRAAYVEGLANLLEAKPVATARPRVVLTSSTAVYGQTDGSVVNEDSETTRAHFAACRLLEAESLLFAYAGEGVVLRLGGIYGPERQKLLESVRDGRAAVTPGQAAYTNRIHRDDAAGAVAHLLSLPRPEAIYLGVDDEPALREVVVSWLAEKLGVPAPIRGDAEGGSRRPVTNKRCDNHRLRASGYRFAYPTFREGYTALLAGPKA